MNYKPHACIGHVKGNGIREICLAKIDGNFYKIPKSNIYFSGGISEHCVNNALFGYWKILIWLISLKRALYIDMVKYSNFTPNILRFF